MSFNDMPGEVLCHIARFLEKEYLLTFFLIKKDMVMILTQHRFFALRLRDLGMPMESPREKLERIMNEFKCPKCQEDMSFGAQKDGKYKKYENYFCDFCHKTKEKVTENRFTCYNCVFDVCRVCHKKLISSRERTLKLKCQKCNGKMLFGAFNESRVYNNGFKCDCCTEKFEKKVHRFQCHTGKCYIDYCLDCVADDKISCVKEGNSNNV